MEHSSVPATSSPKKQTVLKLPLWPGNKEVPSHSVTGLLVLVLVMATCLVGCSSTAGNIALGTAGATLIGARSPGQEIEQIYYLGVFDPREQLPPMVYRVRVRGQASILSGMKFGSGWVPASIIDSLGTGMHFSKDSQIAEITPAGQEPLQSLQTGRRLVLFGPEGFREAPKDHRLVIVMGASPEKWFNAVDQSLGIVGQTLASRQNRDFLALVLNAVTSAQNEETRLKSLAKDVENDLKLAEGGQK